MVIAVTKRVIKLETMPTDMFLALSTPHTFAASILFDRSFAVWTQFSVGTIFSNPNIYVRIIAVLVSFTCVITFMPSGVAFGTDVGSTTPADKSLACF